MGGEIMIDIKKLKISDERLKQLSRSKKQVKISWHISQNLEYQRFFNVGDVLLKVNKSTNKPVMTDDIPDRYLVARNDSGIIYCRRVTKSGDIGTGVFPLCMEDHGRYIYQHDPEQIDSTLLGTEFDPRQARKHYKKVIGKLQRNNDGFKIKFKDKWKAIEWMKTLKSGDVLWIDMNHDGKEIKKVSGKGMTYEKDWRGNVYDLLEFNEPLRWSNYTLRPSDITGSLYYHLYLQKPMSFQEAEELICQR